MKTGGFQQQETIKTQAIYSLLAYKGQNKETKQEGYGQEAGIVGLSRGRFTVAVMRESRWSLSLHSLTCFNAFSLNNQNCVFGYIYCIFTN